VSVVEQSECRLDSAVGASERTKVTVCSSFSALVLRPRIHRISCGRVRDRRPLLLPRDPVAETPSHARIALILSVERER
jgi:hypothetical protein